MRSRYDYADPGTDRVYCEGLSARDEDPCLWCGGECDPGSPFLPYCGPECAMAEAREKEAERYCPDF